MAETINLEDITNEKRYPMETKLIDDILNSTPLYIKRPPTTRNALAEFLGVSNAIVYDWYSGKKRMSVKSLVDIYKRVTPLYRDVDIDIQRFVWANCDTSDDERDFCLKFIKLISISLSVEDLQAIAADCIQSKYSGGEAKKSPVLIEVKSYAGRRLFGVGGANTNDLDQKAYFRILRHIQAHTDKDFSSFEAIDNYFNLPKVDKYPYFFQYFLDGLEGK